MPNKEKKYFQFIFNTIYISYLRIYTSICFVCKLKQKKSDQPKIKCKNFWIYYTYFHFYPLFFSFFSHYYFPFVIYFVIDKFNVGVCFVLFFDILLLFAVVFGYFVSVCYNVHFQVQVFKKLSIKTDYDDGKEEKNVLKHDKKNHHIITY